jgi:AmiR/NasT family two-component response regulator
MQSLRDVIHRLLAAALQADADHAAALERSDVAHAEAIEHLEHLRDAEISEMRTALDNRDLIGQAKGVIMATLRCSPEHAFRLLVTQSQHENRKVLDIAREITARTQQRSG